MGSTPWVISTFALARRSTSRNRADPPHQCMVGRPTDRRRILDQSVEEDLGIRVDGDAGLHHPAEVVRVGVDVDQLVVPGNRVARRRVLAIFHPDGQDDVDLLERLLRRPSPLGAIAPAHGKRMPVGDHPFAAHRGGHGSLEDLRRAGQGRPDVQAAHPRVDPHAGPAIGQNADRPMISRLIERNGVGGWGHAVVLPDLGQEVERQDDRDRPRLAASSDPEGVVNHEWNLRLVADLQDGLADGTKHRGIGGRVHLERLRSRPAVDVGDQADNRHAVEQGLANPREAVRHARTGHDAEDPHAASNPARRVGHDARRGLVRHQQVRHPGRLHRVPELVVLSARNTEHAGDTLATEGRDCRLRAGEPPLDAASGSRGHEDGGKVIAERPRGGRGDRPDGTQSADRLASIQVKVHGRPSLAMSRSH